MSINMKITVDQLIVSPFSCRTQEDKLRIVAEGRPKPNLKITAACVEENAEIGRNCFESNFYDKLVWCHREMTNSVRSVYDEIEWLTGSATTRSFYCWPCLLFQPPGLWNKSGISDIVFVTEAAPEHEKTAEHIEAMFHLQTFNNQNLKAKDDETKTADENPEAFKRLTDVVCSLVGMQQPPNEFDNSPSVLEAEKCMKVLELLRNYDSLNKCYSDDAINLMKRSPEVINNMINAIAKVMKLNIIKDISSSKYVSLILSQHSNVKLKAQISAILRYVKNGKICERFLGFTHIFDSASVNSIYTYIMSVMNKFKIGTKCIALSLDGAILSSDDLNTLFKKLKTNAPQCLILPWHSHIVDYVLQKSLSTDPKCEHFFKTMSAMEAYFCENSELCTALYNFVAENKLETIAMKSRCAGNWFVTSHFMAYVLKYRRHFLQFFDSIVADTSSKWSADDITKALGFGEYLQDLMAVFLLSAFYKIFKLTASLNTLLISDKPERNFGTSTVSQLVINLKRMRLKDFGDLWSRVVKEIGEEVQNLKDLRYIELFQEIITRVIGEIEIRYKLLDRFYFCNMFDFETDEWFEQSSSRLQNVNHFYAVSFTQPQAQSEMEVLCKHGAFSKTSVYDFHEYLQESNLKHTFKALFDASELILALPFKRASTTCDISVLNKIGKWSFGPKRKLVSDDVSIVFVESDYIQEIKESPTFYDEIYANFSQ